MSFVHGKGSKFKLDGIELQTFLTSVAFNPSKDTAETTTMGDTSRDFIEGLRNCSVQLSGRWDPSATTGPDAVLWGAYNSTTISTFGYNPSGVTTYAAASAGYTASAWCTDYSVDDSFDKEVDFSATLQVSGAVTRNTSSAH